MKHLLPLIVALFTVSVSAAPEPSNTKQTGAQDQLSGDATMTHIYDAVYQECGMMLGATYTSSPYYGMTYETQLSLAESPGHESQPCAAWHLSVTYATHNQFAEAKFFAILASEGLNDPAPILELFKSYLIGTDTGWAYIAYAQQRFPEDRRPARMLESLDEEALAQARLVASVLADWAVMARGMLQ